MAKLATLTTTCSADALGLAREEGQAIGCYMSY